MGKNAFKSISTETINCPACGAQNQVENRFCLECGQKLSGKAEPPVKKQEERPLVEPLAEAFATGLASWDLEPPDIVVRRRNRRR